MTIKHLPPIEEERSGFMCKTDFEHELYRAKGGNLVYPSLGDLIENRPCVKQCGIVQVRVVPVKVLREQDFDVPMSESDG